MSLDQSTISSTAASEASSSEVGGSDCLKAIIGPLKPAYNQALVLSFGISLIGLMSSIFALQVYDRVVAKGGDSTLVALTSGMVVAILIDFVLRQGRAGLMRRAGAQVEVGIAKAVYKRLTQLPTAQLESRPPAYWQAMFRDVELVRSTMTGAPALLLIDLPFLGLSLILIGVIAPPLFKLAIGLVLVFVLLAWWAERVMRGAASQEKQQLVSRDAMLGELSAARLQLKAAGNTETTDNRWQSFYASWMEESLGRSKDGDRFRDISQGMTIAATVAMTTVGALAILDQQMSMGALIAANILTGKLVGPLVQLVSQWRTFGQYKAARARMEQLFELPIERQRSGVQLERPKGEIKLDKLCFSYPKSKDPQIFEVSGRLGAGGLHAIVGANGSGKTTLLKLIRGLYPSSSGTLQIDGVDVEQLGQADLADWIGYLPQQPRMISGTIRDNLLLGSPDATDEQIIEACKRAVAYDLIVALPDGFDTPVGEAGSRFSNGQRKRMAIAQTLVNDPPIILMDEPTSDLDSSAEQALVASLKQLSKDHTVVLVTHSPAVLNQCDGVVLLDRGRVAMAGPAAQILPKLGFQRQGPATVSGGAIS